MDSLYVDRIERSQNYVRTSGQDLVDGDVCDGGVLSRGNHVTDTEIDMEDVPGSHGNFNSSEQQSDRPSQFERGRLNLLSAAYESLDYDTCINSTLLDEERKKGYTFVVKKDIARWVVVMVVGILTAIVACLIDISIESLSKYKYTWLKKCILLYDNFVSGLNTLLIGVVS
ncbi:hypothetical protein SK128_022411 [Halocaridina rubra]|uniref:Uncharacterized protein n=1 Tax=Halocaridina rubra TaxID=373956 RepID=A0AAN8XJG5_HALRR